MRSVDLPPATNRGELINRDRSSVASSVAPKRKPPLRSPASPASILLRCYDRLHVRIRCRMCEVPLATFATLKASTQKALIQFLYTDLDLVFTFLGMAKAETGRDADHREVSFKNAQIALRSIQRLKNRIDDPGELQKISDRTNELEAAINAFPVTLNHPPQVPSSRGQNCVADARETRSEREQESTIRAGPNY